jgi:polysaccharide chain length determinant protein (PEP-CTERM system associated)
MKISPEFNLSEIVNTIYRRKDLVIAILLVVVSLAAYLAFSLPDIYRSSTLILVTPQKLPSNYVASTVTLNIEQRMRSIEQQILSRTSLESVIGDLSLFPLSAPETNLEEQVQRLRKNIQININRNETFTVSFDSENPDQAMRVTARIASLFIDENVNVREQQASGTTVFISTETSRLRRELEEQENKVALYKSQHRNELPEQLDANLRTQEQLRREVESTMLRLSLVEERKSSLEKQLANTELLPAMTPTGLEGAGGGINVQKLGGIEDRRRELAWLLGRYSEKHPDVVRLKQEIEMLSAEGAAQKLAGSGKTTNKTVGSGGSIKQMLADQIEALTSEINSLRAKNNKTQSEIGTYQARVENTPLRAIELSKITRNYDITLRKFQDLLGKGFDSQLSENMEKKQKGEQFQVVDPATRPEKPFAPNRQRILLLGLALGLAGGCGMAFLLDNLDTSFKKNEDLDGFTNYPLLAVLPAISTRGSVLAQRQGRALLILASGGTLALGVVLIRLFGSMLPRL